MHPMLPTLQPLPDASALGAIVLAVLGVASEARTAAAADCCIALGGSPAAPAPFGVDAAASSSSPETPPGREARAVFALLGGMRGGVGKLLSPALGGSAAIELDRWELGVNLVLELQYFDLGGGEPPSAAASVGVTVGRREPVCEDATFLRAVARARRGGAAGANAIAREYLERYPSGLRVHEAKQLVTPSAEQD